MKKIVIAVGVLLLTISAMSQNKKWNQISFRGGLDLATKQTFTNYVKMPLKGVDAGFSFDKYWNWYGLGLDVDYMMNQKPVYNDAGLINDIATNSGNFFTYGTMYTTSGSKGTKLSRGFIGIGPSLKYQSPNNKLVAELNLRGGVTLTNGAHLEYSTNANATLPAWFHSMLTRDGNTIPGLPSIWSWGTFYHNGYKNELLGTGKAQVRVNYYVKPNLGVNIGAYYMGYVGAKTKYNYVDWAPTAPTHNYWNNNLPLSAGIPGPLQTGLSSLSSTGVTVGLSYRWSKHNNNTSKNNNNSIAVTVKDEYTGLPLSDAQVTIVHSNGKVYTATTNAMGVANFQKIGDGNYTVSGTLHNIRTNEQNVAVNNNNRNTNVTLTHNDPRFTVQGKAVNIANNTPEAGVSVFLKNEMTESMKTELSQNGNGQFSFQLDANTDYKLVGKKDSYISNIEKVSTKGLTRSQTLYVELQLGVLEVEKGKAIALQKIYYDLDKAEIREDASSDLEKLTVFLQDNPSFKIEIASHTDSRGSDEYNLKLSQARAEAVVNYLKQKGIAANRMVAKGYGETQLINKCANGVNCTEEEHQLNRRTEFKLIGE